MKKRLIFISALLIIVPLTLVCMEKQPLEKTKDFLDAVEKLKTFKDPKGLLEKEITETNNNITYLQGMLAAVVVVDDILTDNTNYIKDLARAHVQLDLLKSLQNHVNKNFPQINCKNDNSNEETKKNFNKV